ncbi:MAG: hypothetical protein CHACPFDD_02837 [Phycisphaerae bacterium]|nr:hypothetical protein [Phycisphaerae bacterium]
MEHRPPATLHGAAASTAPPVSALPRVTRAGRSCAWIAWLVPIAGLSLAAAQHALFAPLTVERQSAQLITLAIVVAALPAIAGSAAVILGLVSRCRHGRGSGAIVAGLPPALLLGWASLTAVHFEEEYLGELAPARSSRHAERRLATARRTWKLWVVPVATGEGFTDADGRWVIRPRFDGVWSYRDGLAVVQLGSRFGVIDGDGEFVVKPTLEDTLFWYHAGLLPARFDGKWGFLDVHGRWAIPPRFAAARHFEADPALAAVDIGDSRWGFVDRAGEFAIEPRFTVAKSFSGDLAPVYIGGELRETSTRTRSGAFVEWRRELVGGAWGFVDATDSIRIPPLFDDVTGRTDRGWRVTLKGESVIIDSDGRVIADDASP